MNVTNSMNTPRSSYETVSDDLSALFDAWMEKSSELYDRREEALEVHARPSFLDLRIDDELRAQWTGQNPVAFYAREEALRLLDEEALLVRAELDKEFTATCERHGWTEVQWREELNRRVDWLSLGAVLQLSDEVSSPEMEP